LRITTDGTLTTLHFFSSTSTPLILGADGNLNGCISYANPLQGSDALYSVSLDGAYQVIHTFGGLEGTSPTGLLAGSDRCIYGVASAGGATGGGTIFKVAYLPPAAPKNLSATADSAQ